MAYATVDDVAALWGKELDEAEGALVERRLAQVERMIIRRVPDLVAQVTAGDIAEADVIDIEADAVLRVVRNADGYVSEGDGNYTYQLSREAADNSLRLLPSEWAVLGIRTGGMFAINMIPGVQS